MQLKIYVKLPGVGGLDDDAVAVSFTATSFDVTIAGYEDSDRRLTFKTLFAPISKVTVKKKPDKIIVILVKEEEKDWPCIAQGTASS